MPVSISKPTLGFTTFDPQVDQGVCPAFLAKVSDPLWQSLYGMLGRLTKDTVGVLMRVIRILPVHEKKKRWNDSGWAFATAEFKINNN